MVQNTRSFSTVRNVGTRHMVSVLKPCWLLCLQGLANATQANAFLAGINIPTASWKSIKNREREMGTAVERVAKMSCKDACSQERSLTLQESTQHNGT